MYCIEPEDVLTRLLLTKSRVWEHECEYRILDIPTDGARSGKRMFDGLFQREGERILLLPRYIEAVTVGAAMEDAEVESIVRACNDRHGKIPTFRAKCHPERFELQFERIVD